MKKSILLLALAGLFSFTVQAQLPHCWTDENYNEIIKNDPQWGVNLQNLETFTQDYIKTNPQIERRGNRVVYVIPVVFHILHNYGDENISDAQVRHAVRRMNEDFSMTNPDRASLLPAFQSIAADCEIEFRLATRDPQGNCTNGIEHIPTLLTYKANNASKISGWPNHMYLNIWIANSLENTGAAAYAHLPGGNNAVDGIMCWYLYAGDTLLGGAGGIHTLSHEAGHHFNLLHVWGQGNDPHRVDLNGDPICGDDNVGDTPVSWGYETCDLTAHHCDTSILENVQNFMEYSYCDNMFTLGQKARMHATLNNSLSGRNNLWTSENLDSTGTNGGPASVCVPVADFKADFASACAATTINFTDQTWKGQVTNWQWYFPGGNPSASNDSNPSVVYPDSGLYDVKLVVSNSSGSDSISKTSFVRIHGPALSNLPFTESFENGTTGFPGVDGWVVNPDGGPTWEQVTTAASTGTSSIKINNYNNTDGAVDEWITPSINFSHITFPVTLNFMLANAQRNSSSADVLKIFYSLNCGQTWQPGGYSKSGVSLRTAGILVNNFTPTNASQWRQESVIINALQNKPNVRLKFQNISNRGNNTYIDDINITGNGVGMEDLSLSGSDFSVYPNPASAIATAQFTLFKSSDVTISVKDVLGRTISVPVSKNYSQGIHLYNLPPLSKGLYMIDLSVDNKHYVRKLIVS